jgi:hypothetical protein
MMLAGLFFLAIFAAGVIVCAVGIWWMGDE